MAIQNLFNHFKLPVSTLPLAIALMVSLPLISTSTGKAANVNANGEIQNNLSENGSNQRVRLKSAVIVEGSYILLSDLFTNAGKHAKTRIAHAPRPGRQAKFSAEWLYRVAKAYGLEWRPLTLKTAAIVERASQEIYREEVEDALAAAFRDQGYMGKFDIDLGNRALNIHVAANVPATIEIGGVSINRSTGRFVATLVTPANTPGAKRYRLTGRIHKLVQIPVISRRLNRGDIVKQNDVEWIDVRERTLRRGHIQDESQIVGMAAKRFIPAKSPLTSNLIQRPELVTKNSLVTISLRSGYMTLKTQGKAMESGSLGDVIRVKNAKSKKVIEAEITGNGTAKVNLIREVALN